MAEPSDNLVAVADAVAAEINSAPAGTFGQTFTAQRAYVVDVDLADLAALNVSVAAKNETEELYDRSHSLYDYAIDVGVRKKVAYPIVAAEVDALMLLIRQIGNLLRRRTLAAYPSATWVKREWTYVYVPEHLPNLHQFTSVLTLTYREIR